MGRFRNALEDEGGETVIDLAPLIDCVFILLIFFIVTTTFVEETGVEVDKPEAASVSRLEKTSILIALTSKGEVVYAGKEIGLGGVRTTVKRLIQGDEELPVIVQADQSAPSGMLVKIIGEAKAAGAIRVSVAAALQNG